MGFKRRARERATTNLKRILDDDPTVLERQKISRACALMGMFNEVHAKPDTPDPHRVGSCVQDSKILAGLLNKWGIESKVICADFSVWNENQRRAIIGHHLFHFTEKNQKDPKIVADYFTRLVEEGVDLGFMDEDPDPYLRDPFSVTIYHEQDIGGEGHDGHAVVETPNFIVDPTVGQAHREGSLEVPQMLVIPKEVFGEIRSPDQWIHWDRDNWRVALRSTKQVRESLERVTDIKVMDLQGLLGKAAVGFDQVAINKLNDDTWIGYALRPDQDITQIYARWNHPEHIGMNRKVTKWLLNAHRKTPDDALDGVMTRLSQKSIIHKGGKVRKGVSRRR